MILWAPVTGQQLYGVDPNRPLPIASTTKLMTALVTLHDARLGEVFTEPDYRPAAADSEIGLVPGERMTVHDLMLAMLIPSADDAAEDLAYNVGHRSVARFIAMMNASAWALGLVHTHYSTPIGLDTRGNYSSASDLVRLAALLLKTDPFFRRAVTLPSAVLHTGSHPRYVVNRNDLLGRYPWTNGVKTGHTPAAGYVLVASATRHGLTLLSAVLGTKSEYERDANTLALLDYGFSDFRLQTPIHGQEVMARPSVSDSPGTEAVVIASRGFARVVRRTSVLSTQIAVPSQLAGPLRRHAVVGTATVLLDGRPVARIPLLLAQALPAVSTLTLASRFITRASTLVSLFALVALAAAVGFRRRLRTRHSGKRKAEPA
jgi:D-alanyl-D-alanine carboxypeptidase (penicillin-binding protein 5/6)